MVVAKRVYFEEIRNRANPELSFQQRPIQELLPLSNSYCLQRSLGYKSNFKMNNYTEVKILMPEEKKN